MVRKTQFSREDIVTAAFMVVRQKGIESLTARNVAQELGSSTAPVYSNFKNMDDLAEAAFDKAGEKFFEYATVNHTPNPFLNMGIGILNYAKDCPLWYFAFSVIQDVGQSKMNEISGRLLDTLAKVEPLGDLLPLERQLLLRKMGVFTHGLAWDICNGKVDDESLQGFIMLMEEVGAALTLDAIEQSPRSMDDLNKLASFCHIK